MRRFFLAVLAAVLVMFGAANSVLALPLACGPQRAQPNSPMLGNWAFNVRDDNRSEWTEVHVITFMPDGTWRELNQSAGLYCMIGDVVLFGYFDNTLGDTMHSVLRGQYDATHIVGTESWDGGGTGTFELRRQ